MSKVKYVIKLLYNNPGIKPSLAFGERFVKSSYQIVIIRFRVGSVLSGSFTKPPSQLIASFVL
jgi:hypothetical protein